LRGAPAPRAGLIARTCISRGSSPGSRARAAADLSPADADRYLVPDAQPVIEAIESLVRLHNAQEEDIYEHAVTG
jgi:hypothetical protein